MLRAAIKINAPVLRSLAMGRHDPVWLKPILAIPGFAVHADALRELNSMFPGGRCLMCDIIRTQPRSGTSALSIKLQQGAEPGSPFAAETEFQFRASLDLGSLRAPDLGFRQGDYRTAKRLLTGSAAFTGSKLSVSPVVHA